MKKPSKPSKPSKLPGFVQKRAVAKVKRFRELAKLFGDELARLHPTGYRMLESVIQDDPVQLDAIGSLTWNQRKLLITLLQGVIVEAFPELGTLDMACRGQGHPFLRRNEAFLCLIPDYRPPRGVGIGIGVRTRDGNWEVEYGQPMSGHVLRERFPRTQFYSWDALIARLWTDKHVPAA